MGMARTLGIARSTFSAAARMRAVPALISGARPRLTASKGLQPNGALASVSRRAPAPAAQRSCLPRSSASGGPSGMPSTGSPMAARFSASSGRPGASAGARPPATSPSGLPRSGCTTSLHQARRGTLVGMVATGATFADAVAEFLRYAEQDRQLKPSTLRGYRSIMNAHLLPAFGERPLEQITTADIEQWRAATVRRRWLAPAPERRRA